MNPKEKMDEKPLTSRCLAIVFKEKRSGKREAPSDHRMTGKELFEEFIAENRGCYWNPHLEESVKSLRYVGCLHSSTLLVGARDIYLDTVKGAWSRKVLRAPAPFSIQKIGDVSGIDMFVIEQTQFTPLPEALCLIISEVTGVGLVASFDLIMENLSLTYKGMQQPSEQIIYETLESLLKERKICHTGNGYVIVTPETYQLPNTVTVNDHHLVIGGESHVRTENGVPTLYIPLLPSTNKSEMCSIACQTTVRDAGDTTLDSIEESKEEKAKRLERSNSMRESTKKCKEKKGKEGGLTRSSSVKYSDEKGKAIVKDINLKTSDVNQDKDKGEKTSVLSKIFGRGKKKKIHMPIEEMAENKVDTEYATFSAQFPPQEWEWYASQGHPAMDVHKQSLGKSKTWHYLQSPNGADHGTQDDYFEDDPFDYHKRSCPVRKSRTLPEDLKLPADHLPSVKTHHRTRSCSSESMDAGASPLPATSTPQSPRKREHRSEPRKHGGRRRSRHERPADARQKTGHGAAEGDDSQELPGYADETPAAGERQEKPSHVARVFRKYNEMKYTHGPPSNDISVEYCGKMPGKGASFCMSRDSGVNCVGLNSNRPAQEKTGDPAACESVPNNNGDAPLNNANEANNQSAGAKQVNTPKIQDNLHHANYSGISPYTTHAQVHALPEQSQEDSGFNSPRTFDLSEVGNVLPRPVQCHTLREHSPSRLPDFAEHSPRYGAQPVPSSPCYETVPITGSDFYPTYTKGGASVPGGGRTLEEIHDSPFTGSNMWSDSSKQTVQEADGYDENFADSRRASHQHKFQYEQSELSPIAHGSRGDGRREGDSSAHRDYTTHCQYSESKVRKSKSGRHKSSGSFRAHTVNGSRETMPDNNNEQHKLSNSHSRPRGNGPGMVGTA